MPNDPFYLPPDVENNILGEARRRRQSVQRLASQVTPDMVARAADIARRHPNLSAGAVQAAVGQNLDDSQVEQLAAIDDGGDDGGFSLGRLFGGAVDLISDGVEKVYEYGIKPTIRGAFLLSETLAQEVVQRPLTAGLAAASGDAPSFRQAYNEYGDSPGINLLQGDLDRSVEGGALGTGFFAAGQAGAESANERTLTIAGQTANLGRALPTSRLAGEMFGYDSFAHNAVAGVTQFAADVLADPLALALGGSTVAGRAVGRLAPRAGDVVTGGVSGALKARKQLNPAEAAELLRSAGAVSGGGRSSVLIDRARNFFNNDELLRELAGHDAYDIYQSFRRSAANDIDADLIRRLGAAGDEATVSEVLLDAVQQTKVTERGFYSGLKGFRRRARESRLSGISPRGQVSVEDLPDSIDKIDSLLRQVNTSRDTRANIFQRLVDLTDEAIPAEERAERFFDVYTDALKQVGEGLDGAPEAIADMTRVMKNDVDTLREFGIDEAGNIIPTPFVRKTVDQGGVATAHPTVQLTSELANIGFELPDVTAIRRAAKRVTNAQKLYKMKAWEGGSDAARWLTRDLFKPAAILRPAYIVRIGLEEQARLAAAGYDSLLTHPVRFIMSNVMTRGDDVSITGDSFEKVAEYTNAMNRRAYNVLDGSPGARTQVWDQLPKPPEPRRDYLEAWRRELAQLSAAREARFLASNRGNLDEFVDWARNTEDGRRTIQRAARINDEAADLLTSDDALREWGHSVNVRLASKAGGEVRKVGDTGTAWDYEIGRIGDDVLLDGVASGKLSNVAVANRTKNDGVLQTLRGRFDMGPDTVKFEMGAADPKRTGKLNQLLNGLFDNITGKPTNYYARYPAFRQGYLRGARETMDALATDDLRVAFAQKLDEAFTLTKAEKLDLTRAIQTAKGKQGFFDDLTELDEVLKARSASQVKELLFDITRRSNIQDTYEVALPFFDAWAEVTKTWARLLKENPAFFIKAGQGYQSARERGVIYANDFGEEVFAYPGGGLLSKFFPGEDQLVLEGRVQGANLVAQGVGPGFGPVVQWATGAFLPDGDENLQQLREWLAPFGTGGIESAGDLSDPSNIISAITPAWFRKFANAFGGGSVDPVQFNSTMGDVMKVLAGSGEYQPGDPGDQQRLLDDANKGARFVLMLRGLTQGMAITGASGVWKVKTDGDEGGEKIPAGWDPEADPDGVFHTLGTLANEYRRLREHYQYDDDLATAAFIDMYGVEPYYIAQAKTRSVANLPVDEAGNIWVRQHQDAANKYPSTIGYFVPPDEDAPLDYAIYRDQIEAGDRQSLTAEQQLQLANQTKARQAYNHAKQRLEAVPPRQRDHYLSLIKGRLEEVFPGWQAPVLGVDSSLRMQDKINELARAVEDPDLADAPATESLRIYMQARQTLMGQAQARGFKTLSGQNVADLRAKLAAVGRELQTRDAAFAGVWTSLLSREAEL